MKITTDIIYINQKAKDKNEALSLIANAFTEKNYTENGYIQGLIDRENQNSTYIDCGVAIPHGTPNTKALVKNTGIVVFHFPSGIIWGENQELAYLAIGIAAKSDEHIQVLKLLTKALDDENVEQKIANIKTKEDIINILSANYDTNITNENLILDIEIHANDIDELKAISLARLTRLNAINANFASAIFSMDPIFLGNGVWLSTSETGNVKEKVVIAKTTASNATYQNHPVKLLITIADTGKIPQIFYMNLATAILNGDDVSLKLIDSKE